MRIPRYAIFLLLLLALSLAARASAVSADRVRRLIQILRTDQSYKVRLRVVITLAKITDRRVPPALIDALSDDSHLVRGIAAKALVEQRAVEALAPLRRVARRDRHPYVRKQARRAVAALARTARRARQPRIYVTVGPLRNRTAQGGREAENALRSALLAEFERAPGITTRWNGGKPTSAELAQRKMKGFELSGGFQLRSQRRPGLRMEIRCRIRVALSTFPGSSIKAFYAGEAAMEVASRRRRRAQMQSLYRELFAGAAEEARKHFVRAYLGRQ